MRLRRVRLVYILPERGPPTTKLSPIKHCSHENHQPSFIPDYRPIIDLGEEMAQTYDAGPVSSGSFDDAVLRISAHFVCGVLLFICC